MDQPKPSNKHHRPSLLFVVMTANATSAPFNEHALHRAAHQSVSICTFHSPVVDVTDHITVYDGGGTVRGFLRAISAALRDGKRDAIHAHAPIPAFLLLVYLATTIFSHRHELKRLIYTVHSSIWLYPMRYRLVLWPIFFFCARVVYCSRSSQQSSPWWLRCAHGKRGSFIRNGVDLHRLSKTEVSEPPAEGSEALGLNLVWIGRLIPLKRPLDPVLSLSQLPSSVSLTIIGDGPMAEQVDREIAQQGLTDRVVRTGGISREEVYRHISEADCLIATSIGEGMPISVLEAMAMARQIVLSDIPSHRELAEASPDTRLFPVGDCNALSHHLTEINASSVDERTAVGERLRNIIESRFSLEEMHAAYDEVYTEVIEQNTTPNGKLRTA